MHKIVKRLKALFDFVVMLLIILAIVAVFLFDVIKPKGLINPYLISGITIGVVMFLFAIYVLARKFAKLLKKLSKKSEFIISITFILLVFIGVFTVKAIQHHEDKEIYAEATNGFVVVEHGSLTDGQVENTLVALQKQLTILRNKYVDNSPEYIIPVHIFTDLNEYHERTQRPDWSGASTQFNPSEPPVMFLPTEQGGGFLSKTAPTTSPAHEMTHVIEFEVLNLKSMKLVPGSFHEGLAQYESTKGIANIAYRLERRFILFLKTDVVLNRDVLPDSYVLDNVENVRLFYYVSFEFMRYLADKYGEGKPWDVLKIVGAGEQFDIAVAKVFGKSYADLYKDFEKAFFIGSN